MSNLMTQQEAWDQLQVVIGTWGDKTFKKATNVSIINHLRREVEELAAPDSDPEELADCAMLLIHLAHKWRISLFVEIVRKFEINQKRKWGKPDAFGVVEHVRKRRRKS